MSTGAAGFELHGEATPVRELLRDLRRSRTLIRTLARKDFFVRYRRATFGLLWAGALPLFQATVLALVFSHVVRVETRVPYAVFVFPAYSAWAFFAATLPTASTSIVDNAQLSNKIYFPRAVLPITNVIANLYGFVFTIAAVVAICVIFGSWPGVRLVLLVPSTLLLVALTTSLALLLSGLHVYFRDVRFLVQAALSVWLFITPVLYPLSQAEGAARVAMQLNPMTGVAQLFRASVTGEETGWGGSVVATCAWVVVLGAAALLVHRRYNRVFSDLL
jgi:ABC-type polysaccharide/polyol phosphate export permease